MWNLISFLSQDVMARLSSGACRLLLHLLLLGLLHNHLYVFGISLLEFLVLLRHWKRNLDLLWIDQRREDEVDDLGAEGKVVRLQFEVEAQVERLEVRNDFISDVGFSEETEVGLGDSLDTRGNGDSQLGVDFLDLQIDPHRNVLNPELLIGNLHFQLSLHLAIEVGI